MEHASDTVGVTLVASLAAAERELAQRRARALAAATGREVRLLWHEPRESVAMLARHGEAYAAVVAGALADVAGDAWRARMPRLEGATDEALRALRSAWLGELAAFARGDVVRVTAPPGATPSDGAPAASGASAPSLRPSPEPPPVAAPGAQPGRSLTTDAVEKSLARHARRVWESTAEAAAEDEPEAAAESPPRAWYEVAARHDGALGVFLVVAPVEGFASFVRSLTVAGTSWRHSLRRDNLERLGARIEVPPARSSVAWTTGDAEDDVPYAGLLASMTPAALSTERPTVFRTDIAGASQRVTGATLAVGARYVVLMPPGPAEPTRGEVTTLDGGWHLWSVDVPVVADEALAATLDTLGLSVGAAALDATWVLTPPRRWELTARGDRVPVFAPEDAAVVQVSSAVPRGAMVAFLWGGGTLERLSLATTERVEITLEALPQGRYVFEVTAEDPAVTPARLAFAVDEGARGRWPVDAPTLRIGERIVRPSDAAELDLSALGDTLPWSITAPPTMPLRVRWEAHSVWDSGWLSADLDGTVDLREVVVRTRTIREFAALGALRVDLGEWGVVSVGHARTASFALPKAREGLRATVEAAALLHAQAIADPQLATALWARPVAAALGYQPRDLPADARHVCAGMLVLALDAVEPGEGGLRTRPVSLLALVRPALSLRAREPEAPRATLDAIGRTLGLTRAIVSDGRRWWALDLARTAPPMPDHLDAVLDDDEGLEGFLVRYGAWR